MLKSMHKVVAACADAMFPSAGPIPVSGTEAGLVAYVHAFLLSLSWSHRILIRLMFLFVELSPLVFGPRRSRFTRLQSADRIGALEAMGKSTVYLRRMTFLSMRAILTMGYFACPRVAAHIMRVRPEPVTP